METLASWMESFETVIFGSVNGICAIRLSKLNSSDTIAAMLLESSNGGGISLASMGFAFTAESRRQLSAFGLLPHFTRNALKPLDFKFWLLKYHSPLLSVPTNKSLGAFPWLLLSG